MTYQKILWGSVAAMFAISILWLNLSAFKIYFNKIDYLLNIAIFAMFYIPYLIYKYLRPDLNLSMAFLSFSWSFCFGHAILFVSYLAYTTNYPLITESLAALDEGLGFYAPTVVLWFRQYSLWNIVFFQIYESFFYQKPFTLLYLSFRGRINQLESFMMQFLIAALLSIIIGALIPAVATYTWYNFPPDPGQVGDMEQMFALRAHIVDFNQLHGIVTFPSFHTASAVIYIYAFRDENKFIFLPILLLNTLLIFSCISHGGHFVVDIFGGFVVANVAIGIERLLFRSIKLPLYKEKEVNEENFKVVS